MHAMRYLLIQLLLQVLLHPDEYWEAAIDVTICCKKSFPSIVQNDKSSGQPSNEGAEVFNEDGPCKSHKDGPEEHNDDASEDSNEDGPLEFMDVLVQTFLSVLPHVSGPVCFSIEQASNTVHVPLVIGGFPFLKNRMLMIIGNKLGACSFKLSSIHSFLNSHFQLY